MDSTTSSGRSGTAVPNPSRMASSPPRLCRTPFGVPVLPEVYCSSASPSGDSCCVSRPPAPAASGPAAERALVATAASIHRRGPGSARSLDRLGSGTPRYISVAPQSAAMNPISASVSIGLTGTGMHPSSHRPMIATTASTASSDTTRPYSPGSMPCARSRPANAVTAAASRA